MGLKVANAKRRYEIGLDDLPVSCPMPDMELWNSHPRIYLPVETEGEAICPYCGAEFVLVKSKEVSDAS